MTNETIQLNLKDLPRRKIRYICFRLQIEADGGNKAEGIEYLEEVKKHFEDQDEFGGWKNFGKTWDVDEKASLVAVIRTSSIQSDWSKILLKEAKPLPEPVKETSIIEIPTPKRKISSTKSSSRRGPDGKFIAKNTMIQETEPKKKVSGQN